MATTKAHWGKPIWVTEGGAELPVTNIAAATALIVNGPGKFSLDRALGLRLPGWLAPLGLVAVLLTVLYAGVGAQEPPEQDAKPARGPPATRRGGPSGRAVSRRLSAVGFGQPSVAGPR